MFVIDLVATNTTKNRHSQFASQSVRNIMTTHAFDKGCVPNTVEHKNYHISTVSQKTPL